MRKNIFQILQERFNYHDEIYRIDELFCRYKLFCAWSTGYPPEKFVDTYNFHTWKQRSRCLNTADMRNILKIDDVVRKQEPDINDIIHYLEYVQNILYLSWAYVNENENAGYYAEYNMLESNINSLLDNINHETYYFDDEEMALIVEKNAEVTAVANIVNENLSMDVIKYNHHLLKGDTDTKRNIILALADKLEPKRKQLEQIDKALTSNLFYMLNNMNIRHNNKEKGNKNYKEYVAKMRKGTLEKWYDETYHLELLAFLQLDNVKRNKDIDALKAKMEVNTNGK